MQILFSTLGTDHNSSCNETLIPLIESFHKNTLVSNKGTQGYQYLGTWSSVVEVDKQSDLKSTMFGKLC